MTTPASQNTRLDNRTTNKQNPLVDGIRILSDITRRDIEKSYNIENTFRAKSNYSFLNDWTLKQTAD